MNRTSFFRGLSIGLLVSFFLWSGIIFGISSLLQEDVVMTQEEQADNTPLNNSITAWIGTETE